MKLRNDIDPPNIKNRLDFQIVDWYVDEHSKNPNNEEVNKYNIDIFGVTQEGYTVYCNVIDYLPYFYVKPPKMKESELYKYIGRLESDILSVDVINKINQNSLTFHNHIDFMEWKEDIDEEEWIIKYKYMEFKQKQYDWDTGAFIKLLTKYAIPKYLREHFVSMTIEKKKDFWGYSNDIEMNFIKVKVKSLKLYRVLVNLFKSLPDCVLYESNIDPFLRFIHKQDIKPSGWVRIKAQYINELHEGCSHYCIQVSSNRVKPLNINKSAPLLIASFDIECSSSHGDFPVPIKDYKKLSEDLCTLSEPLIQSCNTNGKDIRIFLKKSIIKSSEKDVIWGTYKIHRLYLKTTENLSIGIDKCIDKVVEYMNQYDLSKLISELDVIETNINKILTKYLPKLEGDKVIQIGTTFNMFGNSDIIYKSIISLGTCDDIEGVNVIIAKNEKALLMAWKDLLQNTDPDILIGFNIYGFDFKYMYERCCELGIDEAFRNNLGRKRNRVAPFINKTIASSAMGEVITAYYDIEGILIVDVLYHCRKNMNLDSYKLDNIAEVIMGENKNNLTPNELFANFLGNSADRKVIAEYCIQDCALVNRLLVKLKILENNMGMSNVCYVPLNYIFDRGQGVKIYSLVIYECMQRNQVIPVKAYMINDNETDGYEGAIVLPPKTGIYIDDPIIIFDYSSLYPSSMIAENLSHDTIIIDKAKYLNEDGTLIDDKNGELYLSKVSYDNKECVFVKRKDEIKGTIPLILEKLISQRSATRKKILYKTLSLKSNEEFSGFVKNDNLNYIVVNIDTKEEKIILKEDVLTIKDTYNEFEQATLDALQLAYKVTANSLYGQTGAKTSAIYMKDIAACTTATGRNMILIAKKYVEEKFNAEVIYGDSVMPYTPLTLLKGNQIIVTTFEDYNNAKWTSYENFVKEGDNKEQLFNPGFKVWTHKGWTHVVRLIRHKTKKKIYRVLTHTGLVDVTEDHSLIDDNENIIKPVDCIIGTKLLHKKIEYKGFELDNITNDEAYIYGMFVGDGSCGSYNYTKYSWALNNSNIILLEKCKDILEVIENGKFIILNTLKSSGVYKLVPVNNDYGYIRDLVVKYRKMCYNNLSKIIPDDVINSNNMDILEHFRKGLYDSDGNRKEFEKMGCLRFDTKNQITAQYYNILLQKLGYNVSINIKLNIYRITYTKQKQRKLPISIKKINILHEKYEGYVYDIETDYGVFHAGIGDLILKNTDSIFCKFDLVNGENKKVIGKEAIPYAIKKGIEVEKKIAEELLFEFKPQALNYEKVLSPLILFTKKRYAGQLYEFDPNKSKTKFMGIAMKRRDSCKLVKDIFGSVMDEILLNYNIESSVKVLHDWLNRLCDGKVEFDKLIISKTLKSHYKKPESIAHKVLADRIASRDPGNKPAINDRLPYIFIKTEKNVKLQGDKIEHPDYIKANKLEVDYLHYITNQVMKPILQLYTLCVEELPEYKENSKYWDIVELYLKKKPLYANDEEKFKIKLIDLKERKVKELLFNEYIKKLDGKIDKPILTKLLSEPIKLIEIETVTEIEPIDLEMKVSYSKVKEESTIKIVKKDVKKPEVYISKELGKEDFVIQELIRICNENKGYKINIKLQGLAEFVKKYRTIKTFIIKNENDEPLINEIGGIWILDKLDKYIERLIIT
jgi:DNA polymerase elongation subunit (family B)